MSKKHIWRSNAPQTDRMSLRGDHRSRMTLFCAPGPQEFPAFLSTILVHGAFLSTILSARHFPVPFPFVEYFSVPLNCTICANCTFVNSSGIKICEMCSKTQRKELKFNNTCSNCLENIHTDNAKFCSKCGESLANVHK